MKLADVSTEYQNPILNFDDGVLGICSAEVKSEEGKDSHMLTLGVEIFEPETTPDGVAAKGIDPIRITLFLPKDGMSKFPNAKTGKAQVDLNWKLLKVLGSATGVDFSGVDTEVLTSEQVSALVGKTWVGGLKTKEKPRTDENGQVVGTRTNYYLGFPKTSDEDKARAAGYTVSVE